MNSFPAKEKLVQAAVRISPYIHRTPVLSSRSINAMLDAHIFFKCENLQKTGAFKFRGATNAVRLLSDAAAGRGVATHSSGNHAAALAEAARQRGIPAYIVMPENAPEIKKRAVAGYGGQITFCAPTLADREATLERVVDKTGALFIHPYNDERIICGQATAAMEFMEQVDNLDIMITPVGGGGLLSGTALAVSYYSAQTRVLAAEPAGADDAFRSLEAGKIIPSVDPRTIADGLLTSLGDKTFPIIRTLVEQILVVKDDQIIKAMRIIWERMKIVVEPSAAVPLAALLAYQDIAKNKRIGIILSGGNADLDHLPWVN